MPEPGRPYLSPLRYPGGKAQLGDFLARLLALQPRRPTQYVEPFAGGAGAALRLLVDEHVEHVVLNDLDRGIAAFWRSVFFHADDLVRMVRTCRVTVNVWRRQHEIYASKSGDDLALGFATLFLNRVNRSGILLARPIGGLDQAGTWPIAARFNVEGLVARIKLLCRYGTRVSIFEKDGVRLVDRYSSDPYSFIYLDPPYLSKAHDLYLDTFGWDDHRRLAVKLRRRHNWFLTYDADPRVPRELYRGLRCATFKIAHTAQLQHVGREYAVFAEGLHTPSLSMLGRHGGRWLGRPN